MSQLPGRIAMDNSTSGTLAIHGRSVIQMLIDLNNNSLDRVDWEHWEHAIAKFQQLNPLLYPDYYTSKNFHGIKGGYLNPIAPITYDTVTAWATPPNETWIRQQLMNAIEQNSNPLRILDLGCGTGSQTLMLKRAFPTSTVTGLDLSPYMLVMAEYKAHQNGLAIEWVHNLAEATTFSTEIFDLITVCFLFHETPTHIARLILKESYRLLRPGGQLLVLDGNQRVLRHADWLIKLFREPYSQVYAAENVTDWFLAAGFVEVQTQYFGLIHQLTSGFK
jgi:ubiquinone/menaquinone biosynthesis C-methylase UbiE